MSFINKIREIADWEWHKFQDAIYRRCVKEKVPITGKFSNEARLLGMAKDAVTGCIINDAYNQQVIEDLSQPVN